MTSFLSILAPDIPYVMPRRAIPARSITAAGGYDPERRLIAAIIWRAVRDLRSAGVSPGYRQSAEVYIAGENFADDCAVLNLDPGRARQLIAGLAAGRQKQAQVQR